MRCLQMYTYIHMCVCVCDKENWLSLTLLHSTKSASQRLRLLSFVQRYEAFLTTVILAPRL